MRKDFQIALLCAVSAFPLGLAMSVAPDYFPALKVYPGIFFWGGSSLTMFLLALAAVIALSPTFSTGGVSEIKSP